MTDLQSSPNPGLVEGHKLSSIKNEFCRLVVKVFPDGSVKVRDVKYPSGPALIFNKNEWGALTGSVKKKRV